MTMWASHTERDREIMSKADYWTCIRRRNMRYERVEYPTLRQARIGAKKMVYWDASARIMIYAVAGIYSAYVETIAHATSNAGDGDSSTGQVA